MADKESRPLNNDKEAFLKDQIVHYCLNYQNGWVPENVEQILNFTKLLAKHHGYHDLAEDLEEIKLRVDRGWFRIPPFWIE